VIAIVELLEDALRHVRRSAAKRVVNYNDVLNVEQEIHFRYRHQSGSGAAAAIRHREDGTRGANPVAGFVQNHLARIHLVAKILGDRLRDFGCARINAVDHPGLHRDGKGEPIELSLIEPGLCPGFEFRVLSHFLDSFGA